MKTSRLALAVLLALSASAALAQNEGVASFDVTMHAGEKSTPNGHSRISFSRSAVRMEVEMDLASGGAGRPGRTPKESPQTMRMTMIQKLSDPDHLYLVNDERKTYSVMDLAKMREQSPPRSDETWTVKRLGRDSVAGNSCEKALLTSSKGGQVEVCVATDLPVTKAWWAAMNRGRRSSDHWVHAMEEAGLRGFPIRMTVRSAEGKDTMQMVLVSLEKKSLPAAIFEVPAGYRETSGMEAIGTSPEQQKAIDDALAKMTPEQRKAYEEMMKKNKTPNQ